jgi:hypothetical protein
MVLAEIISYHSIFLMRRFSVIGRFTLSCSVLESMFSVSKE